MATKPREIFSGEVLPGMDVYWYKGANLNANPSIAKVLRAYDGGMCDLVMFDGNGTKDAVYHTSNPALHDHFGQASDNGRYQGSWDFTPWSKDDYDMYVKSAVEKVSTKK
jgi:hypothetical protein